MTVFVVNGKPQHTCSDLQPEWEISWGRIIIKASDCDGRGPQPKMYSFSSTTAFWVTSPFQERLASDVRISTCACGDSVEFEAFSLGMGEGFQV